ncbi:MAG: hypothetical protein P8Y99_10470, partial [Calditrichaceae bacterium]
GSAINSTLFATARLAHTVAKDKELPISLDHRNKSGIPDRAVIGLGSAAAVFAVLGTLSTIVESASITFLFTFSVVCGLAFKQQAGLRLITGIGTISAAAATIALIIRLAITNPAALISLGFLTILAVYGRPLILRYINKASR